MANRPRTRFDDLADVYRLQSGDRLRVMRQEAGLSTYQLAHRLGITDGGVIGRYEIDGVLPSVERMFQIADILGVSVHSIWGFDDGPAADT